MQRLKGLYGEVAGILRELPRSETDSTIFSGHIVDQYNAAVDEISQTSNSDYSRHKITKDSNFAEGYHTSATVRSRIGSLVRRLEQEYGFNLRDSLDTPVVVTVQQNQSVNVTITPIQTLINETNDDTLRDQLEDLRQAIEVEKSPSTTRRVLKVIMEKSWELFIKVLPYVLEHMGKKSG